MGKRPGMDPCMPREIIFTIFSAAGVLSPVLLLAGLIVWFVGRRGNKVDEHPICRRCGFDLIGVDGVGKAGTTTLCPECGVTAEPGRIRIGNRASCPRLMHTGILLAVLGVAGVGLLGTAVVRGSRWHNFMPTWMLLYQSGTAQTPAEHVALVALTERVASGADRGWAVDQAIERALNLQADDQVPWIREWGDLVEAAWHRGLVHEKKYQAFIERGVIITCKRSNLAEILAAEADSQIDVTPMLVVTSDRVGWVTSVTVRVTLRQVVYGKHRWEGESPEQEMLVLGPDEITLLMDEIGFEPDESAGQKCSASFDLHIRGTDRADGDGMEATRAELHLNPTFEYSVAGPT